MKYYLVYASGGDYDGEWSHPIAIYINQSNADLHRGYAEECLNKLVFLGYRYCNDLENINPYDRHWRYDASYNVIEMDSNNISDLPFIDKALSVVGRKSTTGQCQKCCWVDHFIGAAGVPAVISPHMPQPRRTPRRVSEDLCVGSKLPPRPVHQEDYEGWKASENQVIGR